MIDRRIYKPHENLLKGFEILVKENPGDYMLLVVTYGTHPCAYVGIPLTHPLARKPCNEIEIDCYGGLTFGEDGYFVAKRFKDDDLRDYYWYGWDYAHSEDFGYYPAYPHPFLDGKAWRVEEIYQQALDVIRQFKKKEVQ